MGEKTCSANLADTERNERQALKRQQFSAAKSEMAYHNHFVLNSLGGNPKSAMPVPFESVETTQIYLHADLRQKEEAITKVAPLDMPPGRFRPDDELLAFLEGL